MNTTAIKWWRVRTRAFGGPAQLCRGAHAVELAMALLVITFILLAMADFMRFLAVKTLATKGAQEGLALAERLPGIDLDLREKCRAIPVEDECQQFDVARDLIQKRAALNATQLLAAPSSQRASAPQALVPAQYTLLRQPAGKTFSDAVFLRPGDSAEIQFLKRKKTITNGEAPSDLPWSDVLRQYPLRVYVCFEVQTIFPFLPPTLEGCSLASGFRHRAINSDTMIAPIAVVTMTSTSTTLPPPPGGSSPGSGSPTPGSGSSSPGSGSSSPGSGSSSPGSGDGSGDGSGSNGNSNNGGTPPPSTTRPCNTCQNWLCVTFDNDGTIDENRCAMPPSTDPCPSDVFYSASNGPSYYCCGCNGACTTKCIGGPRDGEPCSNTSTCLYNPCAGANSPNPNIKPCTWNTNIRCDNAC